MAKNLTSTDHAFIAEAFSEGELSRKLADLIAAEMDLPTGNIPAIQHQFEEWGKDHAARHDFLREHA